MIAAHGTAYHSRADMLHRINTLEADNARYGASDGRVTEINAIRDAIPTAADYEVVKDTYDSPCDHPSCAITHRRLHNVAHDPIFEPVRLPNGVEKTVRTTTSHVVTHHQWVILLNGARVGDAHDTRREAWTEVERLHPII